MPYYYFWNACTRGDWPAVIRFIESGVIDVNAFTDENFRRTALMIACSKNDRASTCAVISLILLGADINKTNRYGSTPLSLAAAYNINGDNVRILLNRGAIKFSRCSRKPIIIACEYNNILAVIAMLEYGIDCDTTDNMGNTPLYFACREGNTEICSILLDAGADPLIKNVNGTTPYDTAMYHGNIHIDKTGVRQLMTDAIEKPMACPPAEAPV
jgi:ankyrin repeat protein